MEYSSIQVSKEMRERLARYKGPRMSYEDVIEVFTEAVPPETFRQRAAIARSRAARETLGLGGAVGDPSEEARIAREQRWRRMRPIELMEEAFEVSQLVREIR